MAASGAATEAASSLQASEAASSLQASEPSSSLQAPEAASSSQSSAHTLENKAREIKLKRLIFLRNLESKYISGDPEKYRPIGHAKQEFIDEYIKNNPKRLINIVSELSRNRLIPHRATLYDVLACALTSKEAVGILPGIDYEIKCVITKTFLDICKSDEDFFDFIKSVSVLRQKLGKKKLSHSVHRAVNKYYVNKTSEELVDSFVKFNSCHKWTHKDLIVVGHVKSNTPIKSSIISYILFKKKDHTHQDDDVKPFIDRIDNAKILRKTTEPLIAVPLIEELGATINQVEPSLRKSVEVWIAALPNMTLQEVLKALPKLYKLGFLRQNPDIQKFVNEILTNEEEIEDSDIHPIEVFIYMKNLEKGGKPLDPKLIEHLIKDKRMSESEVKRVKRRKEVKCPIIFSNIQKCMYMSCKNIVPVEKRFLITIDVTDRKDLLCLHNKTITALEAAIAFTVFLLRTEEHVTVALYKEQEISIVELDRNMEYIEVYRKVHQQTSAYLVPCAPIDWASAQNKPFDIFLNFIHYKEYYKLIPREIRDALPKLPEVLQKYREKLDLPKAKLVTLCMTSPHVSFADGSDNILDIAGLDTRVPKVLEGFCKDYFC